jgi:hypothetical protein
MMRVVLCEIFFCIFGGDTNLNKEERSLFNKEERSLT